MGQAEQPDDFDAHVFVLHLRCVECNRRWDDPGERWRIYFTEDEPPDPVTYCPECARAEFAD
ncbi:MAG TPA: hypothetical protein VI408_04415 [Gaiellaceae bacterium]